MRPSKQGEYELAIADFDEALALDPELSLACNNRGFTYHTAGEYTQAITDYDRAIELSAGL
ncbi:MAG: tetratricopeptide repeat protein [Anaerolineae bacterium]